jgi:hypothetical protein
VFIISKSYHNIYGSLRGLRAKLPNYVRLNPVCAASVHSPLCRIWKEINKFNSSFKDLLVKNKGEIFQLVFFGKDFLVPELAKVEGILTLCGPSDFEQESAL